MTLMQGDHRHPCCRQPENLYVAERQQVPDGELITRRCKDCNRRHFEMLARPKVIGLGK